MSVKKIFILLITIVAIVIVGAFVLNTLMPNVVSSVINAAEDLLFRVTGLEFDFNADSNMGSQDNGYTGENTDTTVTGVVGNNVSGMN